MKALSKPTSSTTSSVSRKSVLGLAREADDDVGAEREVGDRVAEPSTSVRYRSREYVRRIALRIAGRARLERKVDVLADRVALGDRGDHRLAEVLRVRAREADPLDPVDGVAGPQQLAELGRERRARGRDPRS